MFLLCAYFNVTQGQISSEKSNILEDFKKAEKYLHFFRNDSAVLVLSDLTKRLKAEDKLHTSLGFKIRLLYAQALGREHQYEVASKELLALVDESSRLHQWYAFTDAQIALALIYENLNFPNKCIKHLQKAQSSIKTHQIDSLYPHFCIRISSYHRLFGIRDSSIYYAKEAIRTGEPYQKAEPKTVGHLLMGMLLSSTEFEEAVYHYRMAGKGWMAVDHLNGYVVIMNNLASLHLKNNLLQPALAYNDSSLTGLQKVKENGQMTFPAYILYQRRAKIYKALGQNDSAWHYLAKSHEIQLEDIQNNSREEVTEIEARYNDEKKAEQIKLQLQQIEYEKSRKGLLIITVIIVLIFLGLLFYYYLRLRKAKHKVEAQALLIQETNRDLSDSLNEQIVLQGEIHHRVKNNLQIIISLLELQSEETEKEEVIADFEAMSNRIYSMAAIHDILYQEEGITQVDFHTYIENLCHYFSSSFLANNEIKFNLNIEDHHFNLETSMPLGILMTELLTNSLKYAKVRGEILEISIALEKLQEKYLIQYRDNGPGFLTGSLQEREGGLGTYLLKSMSRQLQGNMESRNENGAVYTIYFKEKNP